MAPGLGEFARIDRFFRPLAAGFAGALNLADDAGLLALPPGDELVVTTDAMVAGVHFLADEDPARLGAKLLRVNLSDLAAMGARPVAYTLTTALAPDTPDAWVEGLARGLAADQARYGIALLGGDSVATAGPVLLSVTALGAVAAGRALRRSGARPGDRLYVSGTPGDARLGLEALSGRLEGLAGAAAEALVRRLREPEPRVELGRRLVGVASAAMDLSDGLAGDLAHLCAASGVAVRVRAADLPLSAAAAAAVAADPARLRLVLSGGDDYELLFTAPTAADAALADLARALDLPLTPIGDVVPASGGEPVRIEGPDGRAIEGVRSWTHF